MIRVIIVEDDPMVAQLNAQYLASFTLSPTLARALSTLRRFLRISLSSAGVGNLQENFLSLTFASIQYATVAILCGVISVGEITIASLSVVTSTP